MRHQATPTNKNGGHRRREMKTAGKLLQAPPTDELYPKELQKLGC
jgi:hypothetical protein